MKGSSSTWYAIDARFSSSRSSAARREALEGGKKLLRVANEDVRLLALEGVGAVNPSPRHRDRVDACGLGGAHVERRVADVRSVGRLGLEAPQRLEDRLGIGLVAL